MYPVEYSFQKSSIYYDVKASPQNHFKAFYKLAQLCQLHDLKKFSLLPFEVLLYTWIYDFGNEDSKLPYLRKKEHERRQGYYLEPGHQYEDKSDEGSG